MSKHEFSPVLFEEVPYGISYDVKQPKVENPGALFNKKIALLVSHGVTDIEVSFPAVFFEDRGATVEIVVPDWIEKRVMLTDFVRPSYWANIDRTLTTALNQNYDLLYIPGGAWSTQVLRKDSLAQQLIKNHINNQNLIAFICTGPQIVIDSNLLQGKNVTASTSIKADILNAGAIYHEDSVITDGKMISAKEPIDMPEHLLEIERHLTLLLN